MDIVELYVIIDDFCQKFMPKYLKLLKRNDLISRNRSGMLSTSEVMLITLLFNQSGYACFKWYYENEVQVEYKTYFKQLPSYNRFIELMPRVMPLLLRFLSFLLYQARQQKQYIHYIDSTKVGVCHNKRIANNKVFSAFAEIGKSTMGWFFGFKLHVTCDTNGNLTNITFTQGNVDDRTPVLKLVKGLTGKLFADKGYIDKKLTDKLANLGITLITTAKKNMKARLLPAHVFDVIMHKKRSIIESVFNIIKNRLQLCHSRHRSINNFIVHIAAVLAGYQLMAKKPKINMYNCLNY